MCNMVRNDLKWIVHVDRMVGKTNRRIGMLKRTFGVGNSGLERFFYFPAKVNLRVCCASVFDTFVNCIPS